MSDFNGYSLTRAWVDFSFENPEKVKPVHGSLFLYILDRCNYFGWKDKFGLPSSLAMEAIGVKNWRTYSSALNDLVEFGFVKIIEKSKNQHKANIISINTAYVSNTKAHTKASTIAVSKQVQEQCSITYQSTVGIDKLLNYKTIKLLNDNAELVDSNLEKWILNEKREKEIPSEKDFIEWAASVGKVEEFGKKMYQAMKVSEFKTAKGEPIANWKKYCYAMLNNEDWKWGDIGDEEEQEFKDAVIYLYEIARGFVDINIARDAVDRDDLPKDRLEKIRTYVKLYDKLGKDDNQVQQIYRDYKAYIFNRGRGS